MPSNARWFVIVAGCAVFSTSTGRVTLAQQTLPKGVASSTAAPAAAVTGVTPPPDYIIGPSDQLSIVFWREKELSADVLVRPDGKISLPLLNDVQAGGLTPEELRVKVTEAALRFVEDPNATVVVRQINSRKVFITGEVVKPGEYALAGPTTVLQLIATAGGIKEYADKEKIVILRTENGRETVLKFNYQQVVKQQKPAQNITLKPGDTVVVP